MTVSKQFSLGDIPFFLEKLAGFRVPGNARQVLDFIMGRLLLSYGGPCKIRPREISRGTGLDRQRVYRAEKLLLEVGLIFVDKKDYTHEKVYIINKNPEKWLVVKKDYKKEGEIVKPLVEKVKPPPPKEAVSIAERIFDHALTINRKHHGIAATKKMALVGKWAGDILPLRKKYSWEEILGTLEWAIRHKGSSSFRWGDQVRSGGGLKKHFGKLFPQAKRSSIPSNSPALMEAIAKERKKQREEEGNGKQ